MRRKIKKEIEVEQLICDKCEKEVDDLFTATLCDICGKEYCQECSKHNIIIIFAPSVSQIPLSISICEDCFKAPISKLFDIYTSK